MKRPKIRKHPDKTLRKKSKPVKSVTKREAKIFDEMLVVIDRQRVDGAADHPAAERLPLHAVPTGDPPGADATSRAEIAAGDKLPVVDRQRKNGAGAHPAAEGRPR